MLCGSNEIMCVQALVNQTVYIRRNSLGNVLPFQQQQIQTYLQRSVCYLRTSYWWQEREGERVSTIINQEGEEVT